MVPRRPGRRHIFRGNPGRLPIDVPQTHSDDFEILTGHILVSVKIDNGFERLAVIRCHLVLFELELIAICIFKINLDFGKFVRIGVCNCERYCLLGCKCRQPQLNLTHRRHGIV